MKTIGSFYFEFIASIKKIKSANKNSYHNDINK